MKCVLVGIFFVASMVQAEGLALPPYQWSGDLRLRTILEKDGDNQARWSERIRARFGIKAQIDPELRVEVRLATAKSNRDADQTLGDSTAPGSKRRYVGLDLGYAEWTPAPFAKLYAGRFAQIAYRPGDSQIILDDDLTLEGVGAALDYSFAQDFRVFASAGTTYIRENYDSYYSEELSPNMINFGQLGVSWQQARWRVTVGSGFYNFTSVQGKNFSDLATGGTSRGNTESPTTPGQIKNPYLPHQYFIDTRIPLGNLDIGPFAEFVQNNETRDPNTALWTGMYFGQTRWDAQLGYAQVGSDAVLGLFTDSDFGGGRADVRGWVGTGRWRVARGIALRVTEYYNRTSAHIDNKEYHRTHFDVQASF